MNYLVFFILSFFTAQSPVPIKTPPAPLSLHEAIEEGGVVAIMEALDKAISGKEINKLNFEGKTALDLAVEYEMEHVVFLLEKAEAKTNKNNILQ